MNCYTVWVTTDCNMMCAYCYEGPDKEKNKLEYETADKIIEFIINTSESNRPVIVDFHGGEPLINFEIIKYMVKKLTVVYRENRIQFGITTNGTICSEEIIDFICRFFSYSLSISIDGREEVHNRYRIMKSGNNSFINAINMAMNCLKKREDVRIRMTVTSETVYKLSEGIKYFLDLGFKIIVPVIDFFDKNWNAETIKILKEQLIIIKKYIADNKYKKIKIKLLDTEKPNPVGICSGGITSCHIDTYGRIFPCAYSVGKEEYILGNVKEGININTLKCFHKIYHTPNIKCEGCNYQKYCISTRCKFLNKIIMGDFCEAIPIVCELENLKFDLRNK